MCWDMCVWGSQWGSQCVRLSFKPVWFLFPPQSLPGLICENLKSALKKNSSINSITHNYAAALSDRQPG